MTDSRWYAPLAGGRVYRFCPHRYAMNDASRVHGVDERISGKQASCRCLACRCCQRSGVEGEDQGGGSRSGAAVSCACLPELL